LISFKDLKLKWETVASNWFWFPYLNIFLFAVTNGFCTGGYMQMAPEKVEDLMKEKVGFVPTLPR